MSIALVVIDKVMAGEQFSNTYGVQIGADFLSIPTDADLSTLGCGSTINGTTTGASGATNLLQAILAWERQLFFTSQLITRVYVTDGRKNKQYDPDTYFTQNLALSGLRALPTNPDSVAPGGICLQVNRVPAGFSHRPGRAYYRSVLSDSEFHVGGSKMIDWESVTVLQNWQSVFAGFITASRIGQWFTGGANTEAKLGIPRYFNDVTNPKNPSNGNLIAMTGVAQLVLGAPVLRQVKRGKKRKKA